MTSSERLANGIVKHTRKMSGRLQVTYVYQFAGHTGHIKQAIKKTPGTSWLQNGSLTGKRGGSNSVYVELINGSDELLAQLKENYRIACQEERAQ